MSEEIKLYSPCGNCPSKGDPDGECLSCEFVALESQLTLMEHERNELRGHLKRILSASNVPALDTGRENDGKRVVEMAKTDFDVLSNTIISARDFIEGYGGEVDNHG